MRINHTKFIHGALFLALAFLTACGGGGGGGGGTPATTFTIGGTVTGLTGTGLVLQNNGGGNLAISTNGSFTFATPQASGTTYTVTVLTNPSGQICTVNPYTGSVASANITTVAVTCASSSNVYTIGGTISGLTGTGLVLQNNGGDNLAVSAGATTFTFSTALASGATYTVTVQTQPTGQTCTVNTPTNTGTVTTANITNVAVTCTAATNAYTIGGTVTGLTGAGLVLQDNSGDNLAISTNGTFVFATSHANSYVYYVTVLTQPAGQTCSVASGVGVVSGANVTVVSVTCATATYTIGGTISGLGSSTGLVLQNNGGDNLNVSANATSFTFSTALPSGTTYNVTVSAQPAGKTCTVNALTGTGPVTSANITTVSVICSAASYTIGGAVSGLTGSGLVLQNNGADDLTVAALATSYVFATPLASGSTYNVTVKTQPTTPAQVCTVSPATGTVTAAVTTANVTCVNAYTIGGTITGAAAGIGPILQNNLGDNLFISSIPASPATQSFTFITPIASGATYSVTQLIRARAPSQNCSAGTPVIGTVSGANVTTVSITCVPSTVVPKFAYVTNSTFNTALGAADIVSAYTINPGGDLAAAATTPTTASGDGPYAVAVDPTGQFAYVVNSNADSISVYGIDPVSGVLTEIDANGAIAGSQPSIATGDNPKSIAIHPSGKFAYVANQGNGSTSGNTLSAYSINMTNGALSAIDADAVTPLTQPTIATGTFPYAVTIDPLGNFAYVANYTSNDISAYTINQTTGALTPFGTPVAAGTGPSSIATDPTGKCALVANNTSNNVMSYTINQTTGALALVTTTTAIPGSAPRSVAIDPNTGLYAYVANAGGKTITNTFWAASTATFTTSTAHGYKVGAVIHVSGVAPAGYNGTYTIVAVPSTTTFTVTIASDPGTWVSGGAVAEGSVSAYSITLPSCAIAEIDANAAGAVPFSVNVDPSGQFVYVANYGSNNVSVYSIGGGALTLVQTLSTGSGPTSVTTTQ